MIKTIKFNASDIVPSLTVLNFIIPQKNTMSILSNIKVETIKKADKSFLLLTASDVDMCLQCVVSVGEVPEEKVSFCMEGKKLLSALKNLGQREVYLQLDDSKHDATFLYENGRFNIPFVDDKDYPNITAASAEMKEKVVPAEKLTAAIGRASVAMANDILIHSINGMRIEFPASGMTCVSMTRIKMVMYKDLTITNNGVDPEVAAFTLPKKPCIVLGNIIEKASGENIRIRFNENTVMIDDGVSFKITAKLMEEKYPDYNKFVPTDTDKEAVVAVEPLMEALKRVMPMGNASSNFVKASFKKDYVTVSVEDLEASSRAAETVSCSYMGEELEIGFDIVGLMEVLSNIKGDNTNIRMKDKQTPAIFREGEESELFEYKSALASMTF